MNVKSTLIALLAVAAAACTPRGDYRNAIPADAAMVVSADLPSLAEKSGLAGENGRELVQSLSAMMKSELKGYETLVDEIVKNPSESGLDLTSAAYLFSEAHAKRVGVLLRVGDEAKLERLLQALAGKGVCPSPSDGDGCRYVAMGRGLAAYTPDAFLVLVQDRTGDASALLHPASMLLRNTGEDGFTATGAFRRMEEKTNDVVMYYNLDILPVDAGAVKMGWPADVNLKDIQQLATVDFESGRAVLDAVSLTDSTVWKKLYGNYTYTFRPLDGTYLDKLPRNAPLCWMVNTLGTEMYDCLSANTLLRNMLANPMMPVDIERIIKSVKGDVAVALTDLNTLGFVLYADVTDKAFMQEFEHLKTLAALSNGRLKVSPAGADAYQLKYTAMALPVTLWVGVKDNRLCVTNKPELFHAAAPAQTLRDAEWAGQVPGKTLSLSVNLAAFAEMLAAGGQNLPMLAALDYATVQSPDGLTVHMEVVAKDRGKNILETLFPLK